MALRTIRIMGDEVLTKKCREVKEVTPRIRELIGDMLETMYEGEKKQVSFITFCCVLLPRAVIEKVGYLDETLFMYCEDVDYCIPVSYTHLDVYKRQL